MAIRFPRLGDGFPRRFAPRNDSLTLSVIIPYNGKVRQESFRPGGPTAAGVVLFTKSSREGHDFAAIILYPMLVPNEMTYLFFLPLLFSNTHRQKTLTPTPVRVFCRLGIEGLLSRHCEERSDAAIRLLRPPKNQCSQKIHSAVTILPQLSGILYAYQERNQDISPITLSPLQTHTGKRP